MVGAWIKSPSRYFVNRIVRPAQALKRGHTPAEHTITSTPTQFMHYDYYQARVTSQYGASTNLA